MVRTNTVQIALLVVAALCFLLAAVGVTIGSLALIPSGLFVLTLALLAGVVA